MRIRNSNEALSLLDLQVAGCGLGALYRNKKARWSYPSASCVAGGVLLPEEKPRS